MRVNRRTHQNGFHLRAVSAERPDDVAPLIHADHHVDRRDRARPCRRCAGTSRRIGVSCTPRAPPRPPRIRLAAKHNWPSRERGNPKTITIVNEDTTGLSIGRRESIPRAVLTDAVYPARLPGGAVLGPGIGRSTIAVDVDQP